MPEITYTSLRHSVISEMGSYVLLGKILLEETSVLKKCMSLPISASDIWKFDQTMHNYG